MSSAKRRPFCLGLNVLKKIYWPLDQSPLMALHRVVTNQLWSLLTFRQNLALHGLIAHFTEINQMILNCTTNAFHKNYTSAFHFISLSKMFILCPQQKLFPISLLKVNLCLETFALVSIGGCLTGSPLNSLTHNKKAPHPPVTYTTDVYWLLRESKQQFRAGQIAYFMLEIRKFLLFHIAITERCTGTVKNEGMTPIENYRCV